MQTSNDTKSNLVDVKCAQKDKEFLVVFTENQTVTLTTKAMLLQAQI